MIEVKGVTKRFGPTIAVNNLSFEVKKGEVLGFLGPNGAGKTTMMRIITCYMPASDGIVKVAGHDTLTDSFKVRERIGYLPESAPLYLDMDVTDYLSFVAQVRGIPSNVRRERIKKITDACGLEKVLGKDIGTLSKGYRQRVGLAQSLIHDPDILILDEPTTGLDPGQIIEIRELIKRIGREKTIILCSHILPEVSATCDRILIINEGQKVASGTPEELATATEGNITVRAKIHGKDAEIRERLEAMENVIGCRVITGGGSSPSTFVLKAKQEGDIGQEVFKMVVENNYSLSELRIERVSLEDVFLHLTTKEREAE
ncbi:MAG: ATP-binding cassette domain-containing protein [Candidatus Coatesbacteria bacterium]|nr:ATP-binding cassette domain-containing protein [Candidatus Coatesbacteria bacterium]